MSARTSSVPLGVRIAVWSLAAAIAATGLALSIVSGSALPLVAFAGLALPMIPVGTPRTARRR